MTRRKARWEPPRHTMLYRPILPKEGSAYMAQVDAHATDRTYVIRPSPDLEQQAQLQAFVDFGNYRIMPQDACEEMFVAESAVDAAHLALEHYKRHEAALEKQLVEVRRCLTEIAVLGMAAAGVGAKEEA
jgi:hypothetical protein